MQYSTHNNNWLDLIIREKNVMKLFCMLICLFILPSCTNLNTIEPADANMTERSLSIKAVCLLASEAYDQTKDGNGINETYKKIHENLYARASKLEPINTEREQSLKLLNDYAILWRWPQRYFLFSLWPAAFLPA